MEIELRPLESVVIDGTPIRLGATRAEVEAALGPGEHFDRAIDDQNRCYYYESNMAVDYDENDTVEFIEFLAGTDGDLHPTIYGVPAFETQADELAALLTRKNGDEPDDPEDGYSLGFLNISVGLYRETTPEDVEELIADYEEDGELDDDAREEIAYETRKAAHWNTIGIGVEGYYEE